jgi:hypothetical protein
MKVELRTPISSASSQVDDQVDATLLLPVMQDEVELVPAGSVVHGTIEDVVPAVGKGDRGRVTMTFAVVQHALTRSRAAIRTRSITFEAEEPVKGSESKRRAPRQPNDVELPAGHPLLLTFAEPLIVLIPKSIPSSPR